MFLDNLAKWGIVESLDPSSSALIVSEKSDKLMLPTGFSKWSYNDDEEKKVFIELLDTEDFLKRKTVGYEDTKG